jgi:hypothetical protein
MEELNASEQLMDLVGDRTLAGFSADTLEEAQAGARAHLSELTDAERVALGNPAFFADGEPLL